MDITDLITMFGNADTREFTEITRGEMINYTLLTALIVTVILYFTGVVM